MSSLSNISRINGYRYTYGWVVRVRRRWNKKQIYVICRLFSDKKYGGKEKSLDIAKKFRDFSVSFFPLRCLEHKKLSDILTLPCFLEKSRKEVREKVNTL